MTACVNGERVIVTTPVFDAPRRASACVKRSVSGAVVGAGPVPVGGVVVGGVPSGALKATASSSSSVLWWVRVVVRQPGIAPTSAVSVTMNVTVAGSPLAGLEAAWAARSCPRSKIDASTSVVPGLWAPRTHASESLEFSPQPPAVGGA